MSVGNSLEMQISILHENYRMRETETVHFVILPRVAMSFAAEQQKGRYHLGTRTTEKVDLLPRSGPLAVMAVLSAV